MSKIKLVFQWIARRFFTICVLSFILIDLWWLRLAPNHYRVGILFFGFYSGFGLIWWLAKNHTRLRKLVGSLIIFFFLFNAWCIAVFMPRIAETAKYNGAIYYLVYYSNWPDSPRTIYQFTKWRGFHEYDSHTVGVDRKFAIRYDEKMRLVNVVKVYATGYESLVFSDSVPPRDYETGYATDIEFDGKKYYVSTECHKNPEYSYLCDTYTSTLYECELDNTSCQPLSFRYTSDAVFGLDVKKDDEMKVLYVYFDIGDYPGTTTLIFSNSANPRCYVEGCEILEPTK